MQNYKYHVVFLTFIWGKLVKLSLLLELSNDSKIRRICENSIKSKRPLLHQSQFLDYPTLDAVS